jgi:hypothetical protein
MSIHYTHEQSYNPPIERPHAETRWTERTPAEPSLRDAWQAAIPVDAPDCDAETVRLYAPYDVLLVVRAGVLRTVLHADDDRTDHAGLSPCEGCGDLVDPVRDARCPWCDAPLATMEVPGGVTLRRGDDR